MGSFNKEVEMKFFLDKFPEKLKDAPFNESEEVDEYFMNDEIAKEGRLYLRIRSRGIRKVLELKEIMKHGYDTGVCNAEETVIEISNDDYEDIKKILQKVLPLKFTIKKIRKKMKFNECEICIDDVEQLGKFIEVEGTEEKILETCKILEIDMNSVDKSGGYAQMMLRKIGAIN